MGLIKQATSDNKSIFTTQEIEYLINLISESNFKGKDLQIVYNITSKLQQEYIKIEKLKS